MGYIGQSMSFRAAEAYDDGKRPWSKWNKSYILEILEEKGYNINGLRKYSLSALKEYFLEQTEWHHTGKFFSETDFYDVKEDLDLDYDILDKIDLKHKERSCKQRQILKEKKLLKLTYCEIGYEYWAGSRRHPKRMQGSSKAVVKADWAYCLEGSFADGTKRKRNFHIIKEQKICFKGFAEAAKKVRKEFDL